MDFKEISIAYSKLESIHKNLERVHGRLRRAVVALWEAGYWTCDRRVAVETETALREMLRVAMDSPPGNTPKPMEVGQPCTIDVKAPEAACFIGCIAMCSKGIVARITGIALMPWGLSYVGITADGTTWASRVPQYICKAARSILPLDIVKTVPNDKFHRGDPCVYCGLAHDAVPAGPCRGHIDPYINSAASAGPRRSRTIAEIEGECDFDILPRTVKPPKDDSNDT